MSWKTRTFFVVAGSGVAVGVERGIRELLSVVNDAAMTMTMILVAVVEDEERP